MLRKYFNIERDFKNRVLTSTIGALAAQVITFVFSVFLARLYGVTEFGHFSVYVGIVSIFTVLATGAFDRAIVFAENDRDLKALKFTVLTITISVSSLVALIGLVAWVGGWKIPLDITFPELVIQIPLGIVGGVFLQVYAFETIRLGNMGRLAKAKAAQNALTGTFQSILSNFQLVPGLIVGQLLGLIIFTPFKNIIEFVTNKNFEISNSIRSTSLKYRNYPRYVLPNELLDAVGNQLPIFLIGFFFSIATAGQYAFCGRILSAPAVLVGQAVGQAFMHKIGSEDFNVIHLKDLIFRVWGILALIGVVPFSLVLFFGPTIFDSIFGSAWHAAGLIAQANSILLFVRFVSSPTSTIYLKLKMQRAQLGFVIAAFIYRSGTILFALFGFNIVQVTIIGAMVEVIFILLFNFYGLIQISSMAESARISLTSSAISKASEQLH